MDSMAVQDYYPMHDLPILALPPLLLTPLQRNEGSQEAQQPGSGGAYTQGLAGRLAGGGSTSRACAACGAAAGASAGV